MRRLASLLLLCLTITGAHAAGPAPQSFVVYFSEWSAALDNSANGIVGHAADFAKEHPQATIAVNGFASTVGSRKANDLLADCAPRWWSTNSSPTASRQAASTSAGMVRSNTRSPRRRAGGSRSASPTTKQPPDAGRRAPAGAGRRPASRVRLSRLPRLAARR